MEVKISVRHGSLSPETRSRIASKLEHLDRLFDRLTFIDATIDLQHRDAVEVTLRVSAEHKHDFMATCRSNDLLGAVDQVIAKMEQQLRRYKEKIQEHRPAPEEETESAA